MKGQSHTNAPWEIPLYAGERTQQPANAKKEPSALLRWLDTYFRSTPRERMRDPHIAYWH